MKYAIKEMQFGPTLIVDLEDKLYIPTDPANSDYQKYLAWFAEGNTAEEWQPE
jgi:hypothetical protein